MALLRLANDETKKITLGDDPNEFIVVKSDISKRQFIQLIKSMPEGVTDENPITLDQGVAFQTTLFDTFIVDWSLSDVPATVDNYLNLSREAAEAVDEAIAKHFESLTPSKDEATKSAGPSD